MTKETRQRRPKLVIFKDGLKPDFVSYRNPQDDKIGLAIQEAAKRLKAEGKPLVKDSRASNEDS